MRRRAEKEEEEVGLRHRLLRALKLDCYESRLRWTQRVLWPVLGVALLLARWSLPVLQGARAVQRLTSTATQSQRALVLLGERQFVRAISALGRNSWVQCLLRTLALLALLEALLAALAATSQTQIVVFGRPLQLHQLVSPGRRCWASLLPRHLQMLPAHRQRLALHMLPLGHRALEFKRILPVLQRIGMLLALAILYLHGQVVLALGEARDMRPAHSFENSRPATASAMAPFRSTTVHPHRAGLQQCMAELQHRSQL